jgi:CPA2 family monovalent cation:H+ antiporter-2
VWPFGYHRRTVLLAAVGMAQIGEFSFILAQQGMQLGVLNDFVYGLTLSGALLSILVNPFLLRAVGPVAAWLDEHFPPHQVRPGEALTEIRGDLRDHVVICGYGGLGSHLGEALRELGNTYLVIEQDWRQAQHARNAGAMVIYGDASTQVVLQGAALTTARAVAITIPDPASHRLIVQQIRALCPRVPIIARARVQEDLPHLYNDGANEVIVPRFEGGLEMLRQTLLRLGVTADSIQSYIDTVHSARYEPWRQGEGDSKLLNCLRRAGQGLTIEWYQIPPDSIHVDYTIGSLRIRQQTGASVVAVLRDTQVLVNPEASTQLQPGDRLAVIGTEAQRQAFVAWLMNSRMGMTVPLRRIGTDAQLSPST